MKLTKKQAVMRIIDEACARRVRKHAHSKCWNALMELGLNNVETGEVLTYLELQDESGSVYAPWESKQ